ASAFRYWASQRKNVRAGTTALPGKAPVFRYWLINPERCVAACRSALLARDRRSRTALSVSRSTGSICARFSRINVSNAARGTSASFSSDSRPTVVSPTFTTSQLRPSQLIRLPERRLSVEGHSVLEIPFEGARSVVAGAAKTFTFDGSAKTAARKSTYRTPDAIIVKMKSG